MTDRAPYFSGMSGDEKPRRSADARLSGAAAEPDGDVTREAPADIDTEWEERQLTAYGTDFDVRSWIRAACEHSRVTFAVTDPVALSKLCVLTRSDPQR